MVKTPDFQYFHMKYLIDTSVLYNIILIRSAINNAQIHSKLKTHITPPR